MTFEQDGRHYRILFSHSGIAGWREDDKPLQPIRRKTRCFIEQKAESGWRRVAVGEANCSEKDQFVREVGRQIALRRAAESISWVRFDGKTGEIIAVNLPPEGSASPLGGAALHAYYTRKRGRR